MNDVNRQGYFGSSLTPEETAVLDAQIKEVRAAMPDSEAFDAHAANNKLTRSTLSVSLTHQGQVLCAETVNITAINSALLDAALALLAYRLRDALQKSI